MGSQAGRVFHRPWPDGADESDETWVHGVLVGGMASESDPIALARAYADAAARLIDPALASGEPWRLCYPIFYLYRHALELYLKAVLPRRRLGHDLRPLILDLETRLRDEVGAGIPDTLRDDLLTLAKIDPDAQGFRYTTKGSGDKQLLHGEYWVPLRDLQQLMEAVFDGLEKALRRLPR